MYIDPWPCIQLLRAELHAIEIWPLTETNLQRNDRAMIRQICSIKPEDVAMVRSSELPVLAKLELEDLNRQGAGRPKLTWKKLTEKDCCEWKFMAVDP